MKQQNKGKSYIKQILRNAKSVWFNPFTEHYDTYRRYGGMVVPNCPHGRCDSAHLGDRKCMNHFTPLAQRTVGDLELILTVFGRTAEPLSWSHGQSSFIPVCAQCLPGLKRSKAFWRLYLKFQPNKPPNLFRDSFIWIVLGAANLLHLFVSDLVGLDSQSPGNISKNPTTVIAVWFKFCWSPIGAWHYIPFFSS